MKNTLSLIGATLLLLAAIDIAVLAMLNRVDHPGPNMRRSVAECIVASLMLGGLYLVQGRTKNDD